MRDLASCEMILHTVKSLWVHRERSAPVLRFIGVSPSDIFEEPKFLPIPLLLVWTLTVTDLAKLSAFLFPYLIMGLWAPR